MNTPARLGVEQLEPRDTPAGAWVWNADGTLWGRALHIDRVHPARTYTPPALVAEPHPALPGDPARVQAELSTAPPGVLGWAAGRGIRVVVFAAGRPVTDLPEFAYLRGVPTGAAGDGPRTYDAAPAVASGLTAYVRPDLTWPTLHELGHCVHAALSEADRRAWSDRVHPLIRWDRWSGTGPVDYYRLNPGEAFAEAFKLWARSSSALQPEVRAYFAELAGRLGWG